MAVLYPKAAPRGVAHGEAEYYTLRNALSRWLYPCCDRNRRSACFLWFRSARHQHGSLPAGARDFRPVRKPAECGTNRADVATPKDQPLPQSKAGWHSHGPALVLIIESRLSSKHRHSPHSHLFCELIELCLKCLGPQRRRQAENLSQTRQIETRVAGPLRLCWVLIGAKW